MGRLEKAIEFLKAARDADPTFTEPTQLSSCLVDCKILMSEKRRAKSFSGKKTKRVIKSSKKARKKVAKE